MSRKILKDLIDSDLGASAWEWLKEGKGPYGYSILWDLSSRNEEGTYHVAWAGTSATDTYTSAQIVGMAIQDGWLDD